MAITFVSDANSFKAKELINYIKKEITNSGREMPTNLIG